MAVIRQDRMIIEETSVEHPCGPEKLLRISEAGGLMQFGAFVERLPPRSKTSLKHWHSAEDEMVYVLEGEITLCEGATETVLRAGDAATFRAGDPSGHCFENRSTSETRCLVVGTRANRQTRRQPLPLRPAH